jgi:hypothetical protein
MIGVYSAAVVFRNDPVMEGTMEENAPVGAVENLCKHYGDVKAVMGSFLFALPAGCTCNLTLYALRPMIG